MDKQKFFAEIRSTIFRGSLTQPQVDGVNALLDACSANAVTDPRQVAYVLATPVIETGGRFEPISEDLRYSADGLLKTFGKYFSAADAARYARNPQAIANRAYANRIGNGDEASGDGWRFHGRGYVQITGRANYCRFGKILGIDLIGSPDLALQSDVAAKIAVVGMRDGLFTDRKLSDYITASRCDYVGARRIINGQDRAQDTAGYADRFRVALAHAGA